MTTKVNGIELYLGNLDNIATCKKANNVTMLDFWKMTIRANFSNRHLTDFDQRWKQLLASL